ncbi:restriction endonuclease [Sphingobium chungangianum]
MGRTKGDFDQIMRSTYAKAPIVAVPQHLTAPLPQQFGLPAEFDGTDYMEASNKRKGQRRQAAIVIAYILCFSIILYGLYRLMGDDDPDRFFRNPWIYIIPAFWAAPFALVFRDWMDENAQRFLRSRMDPSVRSYLDAVVAHDAALRNWKDRQTEAGQTYWREKRGVSFESAMRDFLVRRGCSVDTTKGSGDGGIDLIVRLGGTTHWCQCKGHASPVGVAVVREIAGVCSRGGGSPVVIAVNGYTSAAVETANQLGVLLIDTPHLIRLAKQDRISQWH